MTLGTALRRTALPVTAGLLVLTAAGCGGDDQSDPSAESSPGTTVSASPSTDASSGSTPTAESAPKQASAMLRAGKTATQKVPQSAVYAIESENDGNVWEVEVVTQDGTKHEMQVSRNGNKVVQGPRNDGRKAKYRERVTGAELDYVDAAQAVLAEVPGARFEELNLDQERGRLVWEAEVVDNSGIARDLEIDAGNGEVLRNEPDR